MTKRRTTILAVLGGTTLLMVASASQAQTPAGVTAAVNPQASGTPPAELPRVLEIGSNVVQNEHLSTGPEGQAQFLFRDGSTLTLGPGSDLTIDNFVYDPEADTAKLAMTTTFGAFRFVGGAASKTEPVILTTPTATIGIRGGINFTTVAGDTGETETSQAYGTDTTATSKSTGEQRVLTKNGFTMLIKPNQSITTTKIDLAKLNAMLASFQGRPGASGGATTTPNQNSQQARNVAITNSSQPPTAYVPGGVTISNPISSVLSIINQQVAQAGQVITTGTSAGLTGNGAIFGAFTFVLADATGSTDYFLPSRTDSTTFSSGGFTFTNKQVGNSTYTLGPNGLGLVTATDIETYSGSGSFTGANNIYVRQITVGTARPVEIFTDSGLQIGRLTNGTVLDTGGMYQSNSSIPPAKTYTLNSNQGFAYALGPAASLLPSAGTFQYNMTAATSPTYANGATAPGIFNGALTVTFGSAAFSSNVTSGVNTLFTVLLTGRILMPDGTYQLSSGGGSAFQFSSSGLFSLGFNVSASTGARACGSSCFGGGTGFLSGPGGLRAALSYVISGGSTSLSGVAAFRR